MKITIAESTDLHTVSEITRFTINTVYPHYYPKGAVDFFLSHHCVENINNDIQKGLVYLLGNDEIKVGTVTVKENEILRLFVLPDYQGMGFGKMLLDFAEQKILENYNRIEISASFPAKNIYLKRGYITTDFTSLLTDNGDYLCFDTMEKALSID